MFRVKLTAKAKRGLKIVSKSHRQPVAIAIEELKDYPIVGKPLGKGLSGKLSIRIGVYRIVYKIDFEDKVVLVVNVDHRGVVYN